MSIAAKGEVGREGPKKKSQIEIPGIFPEETSLEGPDILEYVRGGWGEDLP
jgi:hypothetical protein